jgi:beta-alanine degradation protein BauB
MTGGTIRSQEAGTQTQRIPQFENEDVKVWKSVVMPNAPLTMHRHEHPRVIIALSGGTMKIVEQNGASIRRIVVQTSLGR